MSAVEMIFSTKGILIIGLFLLALLVTYRHLLIGKIWRYRRDVIYSNIKSSFPEKTEKEHQELVDGYYKHLADLLIEPFLILTPNAEKRVEFNDLAAIDDLREKNKDIVLFCSHYGNWENMCFFPLFMDYEVIAVYTPVKNMLIDNFLKYIRGKHGVRLIAKDQYYKTIMGPKNTEKPRLFLVVGDQSPSRNSLKMKFPFLNHNTPVQVGAARIARKLKCALMYMDVEKVKPYNYQYNFKLLAESVDHLDDTVLMKMCYAELEKTIQRKPEFWLWSHRRWKHEHVD